jgi:hypothetical protein
VGNLISFELTSPGELEGHQVKRLLARQLDGETTERKNLYPQIVSRERWAVLCGLVGGSYPKREQLGGG